VAADGILDFLARCWADSPALCLVAALLAVLLAWGAAEALRR